jgi:hypothetical protein
MQPLWKIVWRLLKKLKIDLPSDPAKPLLRIHPKECQIRIQQSHLHTHVYCSTIHNSSSMETVRMPLLINGIRKFIYNGMLFSRKEEWNWVVRRVEIFSSSVYLFSVSLSICVCMWIWVQYIYTYIFYIYLCIYVCIYVCICVYIYVCVLRFLR